MTPFDAAPLTCAGVTTYKAIKVAHIRPSEKVAIFGVGGLGHLAVQYARLVGGIVIAVDVDDEKLELARSSAPTTSSTRRPRTRSPRSRRSAAPTSRW